MHIAYSQDVKEFFIAPNRTRTALILCQNSKGEFILGKRTYYPEGIGRMLGGGIDNNEEPVVGAIRELREEINLDAKTSDLKELCLISTRFTKANEQEHLDTYVYYYNIGDLILEAGDDVSGFIFLSLKDLKNLLIKLESLTGIYPSSYARSTNIRWEDWAKFHSYILSNTIKLLS